MKCFSMKWIAEKQFVYSGQKKSRPAEIAHVGYEVQAVVFAERKKEENMVY